MNRTAPSNTQTFQKFDLVEFPQGDQMIVTGIHRNRPANPYSGVKPNGNGAEYKFGPKHRAVKVGSVSEGHPALLARAQRRGETPPSVKRALSRLFDAIDNGDMHSARAILPLCRAIAD